jgi:site-specific recombinase XerD
MDLVPSAFANTKLPSQIVFGPVRQKIHRIFHRNPNTRKAYMREAVVFMEWCGERGVTALPAAHTSHVAACVEHLGRSHPVPTVKLRLAAIRHCSTGW